MNIEDEIFNRYITNTTKLIKYGLKKENNILTYKKLILDNTFEVIIKYEKTLRGQIIDLSFNEEYTNFRALSLGEFSSKIKKEFENILLDIRQNCCIKRPFINNQTNIINDYIINNLNSNPEFLWEKYPNFAVYRCSNNKWFSIIMDIPYNKINKESLNSEIVEIINVKINPLDKEKLLNIEGIYEAYHMNKKSWISIILNNKLPDEKIISLINESYSSVSE